MFKPLKIMMVCTDLYHKKQKIFFKIAFECSMINLNKASHHESAKLTMNPNKQDTAAFLDFNSEI